jgi:DNA-binding transcriptional ArsR family regulator
VPAVAKSLDRVFHALSSPARRAVVERLGKGPASVKVLAEPLDMALPSFLQHLRVLEDAGIVKTEKRGRVRTVRIVPARLRRATDWLERQRTLWERRLDRLDAHLKDMEQET